MDNQYFEEPEYPFFHQLNKCLTQFMNFSAALLCIIFIMRIMELVYISKFNSYPTDMGRIIIISVIYDFLFFIKILPYVFIPFVLSYFNIYNKEFRFWIFGICGTLIILIHLMLVKYFGTALVPLGADLFGYTLRDIKQTVGASTVIDIWTALLFIIPLVVFWILLKAVGHYNFIKSPAALILFITGIALIYFDVSTVPGSQIFKNEFSYNLATNKSAFLTERSLSYFNDDEPIVDIYPENYFDDTDGGNSGSFKFINSEYPFFRKDETPDVLGPFFNIDSINPPNFVFIQVEGLGRAFSGNNAYLGSFTPFLDNLASKSIYFENFIASQGRTFASLPSIMGSLPFGEKGFNDLEGSMPGHISLPRILKKNGYTNRFYCGVDLKFDNQDIFIKNQGFDVVVSDKDYDSSIQKGPEFQGFTWGYADREMIIKALESEKSLNQQPFLTYMQTVSMHNPFKVPQQDQYFKVFENHLSKLGFNNDKKKQYRKYKDIYSTILYSDLVLSMFFKEYAKLPAFSNTIFIITGDHRLPEIPMSSKIDRFHVPLIIYSPLLNKSARIKSISSHLDIAPSLVTLLKRNYKLNTPDNAAWVGSGLDTVRTFRNIHKYPLIQTKSDFHNYISGRFFLDQNSLYLIGDNMTLTPADNENKLNELRSELNQQKGKNLKFAKELKLIPDSVYSKFR